MTNASTSSQANPPKSLESRITLTCDLGEYACNANAFVFVDEAQVGAEIGDGIVQGQSCKIHSIKGVSQDEAVCFKSGGAYLRMDKVG